MRERGEVGIEVVAVQPLERGTDGEVKLETPSRDQIVVERLAHQLVDEGVAPRHGGVLGDHAGIGGSVEHLEQPRYVELGGGLEHAELELTAHHRGHLERGHGVLGKVGQPAAQQGSHLLGEPAHRVGDALAAVRALAEHQAHRLAEEEGVAAREHVELGADRRGGLGARDPGQVGLHIVDAQAVQRQPGAEPGQLGERLRVVVGLDLALAVGADHEHRRVGYRLAHEPQQHERCGVRGVKVVQGHDQRPAVRRLYEEARGGVEEAKPQRLGIGRLPRCGGQALEVAAERADRLDPGPVRGGAALLPATSGGHPPAPLPGLAGELLHQARLAYARLAAQEDEGAAPLLRRRQVRRGARRARSPCPRTAFRELRVVEIVLASFSTIAQGPVSFRGDRVSRRATLRSRGASECDHRHSELPRARGLRRRRRGGAAPKLAQARLFGYRCPGS